MTVNIRSLTTADADAYIRMWSNFAGYLRNLGDADEQGMTREKFLRDGFGADPAFAGFIAEKIREIARAKGIPIVENKPLARLLYSQVEVGRDIPETLYRAVAEVLAYVYGLRRRGGPAQTTAAKS